MKPIRLFLFVIALTAAPNFIFPVMAADAETPALKPNAPPLVVARLSYAPLVDDLLNTRQFDALGLQDRDYSGELPGVGVRVASLRGFLEALAGEEAEYVWYCLAQQGSSLASQTGAMGWEGRLSGPAGDPAGATAWLENAGVSPRRRLVESGRLTDKRSRVTISRDEKARRELLEGSLDGDASSWRYGLNRFLERDYAGIWLNPRPLLGIASLFTGVDFRSVMTAHRLSIPTSIQLDLFDNDGDLGLSLLAENILSEELRFKKTTVSVVRARDDALLEVNIVPPADLWNKAASSPQIVRALSGLNIDIAPLTPRSVAVVFWRGEEGRMRWSAACLMPDADEFSKQFQRIRYLLERLSSVTPPVISLESASSPRGDALMRVEAQGVAFVAGLAEMEYKRKNRAVLLLSGREEDWPDAGDLRMRDDGQSALLAWRLKPDAHLRRLILSSLLEHASDHGAPISAPQLDAMLPDGDSGTLDIDGADATLVSRNGMLPFLLPLCVDAAALLRQPTDDKAVRMIADRLRFLLDIISQIRFRRLDAAGSPEERWPDSLSQLPLNDADMRRWMDSLFGVFHGDYRPTLAVLQEIATGARLDGVIYRIVPEGQVWYLTAETREGPLLRIDYRGRMSMHAGDGWTEYREKSFSLDSLERFFQAEGR